MIFVTLGTQDKPFTRLLDAVEKAIEEGYIKDEVIVQAGFTKYNSKNMKIYDYLDPKIMDKYFENADLVITHGGVGSILNALSKNKTVIAAARICEYKEHTNNHQLQIVKKFADYNYILELEDFDNLGLLVEKAKTFKPKKYKSNNADFNKLLEDYINNTNHISWLNKIFNLFQHKKS